MQNINDLLNQDKRFYICDIRVTERVKGGQDWKNIQRNNDKTLHVWEKKISLKIQKPEQIPSRINQKKFTYNQTSKN